MGRVTIEELQEKHNDNMRKKRHKNKVCQLGLLSTPKSEWIYESTQRKKA